MKIAVVGAGWAGLAAAVQACRDGHHVTVYEAARTAGGRARTLTITTSDGATVSADNGQHILIGAYTETLSLMRMLGVDLEASFVRQPLDLRFADGSGLRLRDLPPPWDVLIAVLGQCSWPMAERLRLLRAALVWQRSGYACPESVSVRQLCAPIGPRVMSELIEPLCVSALNTPCERASGQVFLRVLRDALFSGRGGSHLWLPRRSLGQLLPEPALAWLQTQGARVEKGTRVTALNRVDERWQVSVANEGPTAVFDAVILATPSQEAARLARPLNPAWAESAQALEFEPITTVYALSTGARKTLDRPMMSLRCSTSHPAQFVFDRGDGLMAFVVSASSGERNDISKQVVAQASVQLGLTLELVQTVVEKRATFACTPGLLRPVAAIAPRLIACGDYVQGPYPATLEGAVRSGLASVQALS